jgi:hypothetical protein
MALAEGLLGSKKLHFDTLDFWPLMALALELGDHENWLGEVRAMQALIEEIIEGEPRESLDFTGRAVAKLLLARDNNGPPALSGSSRLASQVVLPDLPAPGQARVGTPRPTVGGALILSLRMVVVHDALGDKARAGAWRARARRLYEALSAPKVALPLATLSNLALR